MNRFALAVGELWALARGRRRRLRVMGQSMEPTLHDGQFVLFEPAARFDVGDVVVARHPSQPITIIKRVVAVDPIGLVELASDNLALGNDSRDFGRIDVDAVDGRVTVLLEWPIVSL